MAKSRGRPAFAASRRSRRAHSEWNVDSQGCAGGTPARKSKSETRFRISSAALFVKVTARIASAGEPLAMRLAIRNVMARVLPVPAPARISTGPSVVSAACRCSGFSSSRRVSIYVGWVEQSVVGCSVMVADGLDPRKLREFRQEKGHAVWRRRSRATFRRYRKISARCAGSGRCRNRSKLDFAAFPRLLVCTGVLFVANRIGFASLYTGVPAPCGAARQRSSELQHLALGSAIRPSVCLYRPSTRPPGWAVSAALRWDPLPPVLVLRPLVARP